MSIIETPEFTTKFEKFNRLMNITTYNETTAKNLREIARQAVELAEMIEKEEY